MMVLWGPPSGLGWRAVRTWPSLSMKTPLPEAPPERRPTVAGMTFLRTALTCCWIALRSATFSGADFSSAGIEVFFSAAARPARSPASRRAEKTAVIGRRSLEGGGAGWSGLTEDLPEQLG